MKSTLSLLLVFLNQFFMPRHNAQLRLLKAQITILRARIPTQRIILSPAEKAELLRIGAECGHDIDGLLEVAKPATYKRWLAQMRAGTPFKAVGRPRLTRELRDVVIRIGSENLFWGYKRIAGELKKLGLLCRCQFRQAHPERGGHPPKPRATHKEARSSLDHIYPGAYGNHDRLRFLHQDCVHVARAKDSLCADVHPSWQPPRVLQRPDLCPGLGMGDAAGPQHLDVVRKSGNRARFPHPRCRHQVQRQL